MKREHHPWSDDDNLIAYYLYRFGDAGLTVSKKELGDILGMGLGSLSYKIGNFKAIDGQGNLDGYSIQAVRIYKRYSVLPDEQVRIAGEEAVLRALGRHIDSLQARIEERKSEAQDGATVTL